MFCLRIVIKSYLNSSQDSITKSYVSSLAFLSCLENFMFDLCQAKPCLNQFINQTPSTHLSSLGLHLFSVVTFHKMELLPSLQNHNTVAPNLYKMHWLLFIPPLLLFIKLHIKVQDSEFNEENARTDFSLTFLLYFIAELK